MFVCQFCKTKSKSGEPSNTIVTKKRKVLYGLFDKSENQVGKKLGWEIVSEVKICKSCENDYIKTKGE